MCGPEARLDEQPVVRRFAKIGQLNGVVYKFGWGAKLSPHRSGYSQYTRGKPSSQRMSPPRDASRRQNIPHMPEDRNAAPNGGKRRKQQHLEVVRMDHVHALADREPPQFKSRAKCRYRAGNASKPSRRKT